MPENFTYDNEYFKNKIREAKNSNYDVMRGITKYDILVDLLNTEEIFNYYDVEWLDFSLEILKGEANERGISLPFENVAKNLPIFVQRLYNLQVRIKFLLFLQRNLNRFCCKTEDEEIEDLCASLISESAWKVDEQVNFHIEYIEPLRQTQSWMLRDNIFAEKTPFRIWQEQHNKTTTSGTEWYADFWETAPDEIKNQYKKSFDDILDIPDKRTKRHITVQACHELNVFRSSLGKEHNLGTCFDDLRLSFANTSSLKGLNEDEFALATMIAMYLLISLQRYKSLEERKFYSSVGDYITELCDDDEWRMIIDEDVDDVLDELYGDKSSNTYVDNHMVEKDFLWPLYTAKATDEDKRTFEDYMRLMCREKHRTMTADIKTYLKLKVDDGIITRPTQINDEYAYVCLFGYPRTEKTYYNS